MILITSHTNADFDSLACMVAASREGALPVWGLSRPPAAGAPRPVTPCLYAGRPLPWGTSPFPKPLAAPPPWITA